MQCVSVLGRLTLVPFLWTGLLKWGILCNFSQISFVWLVRWLSLSYSKFLMWSVYRGCQLGLMGVPNKTCIMHSFVNELAMIYLCMSDRNLANLYCLFAYIYDDRMMLVLWWAFSWQDYSVLVPSLWWLLFLNAMKKGKTVRGSIFLKASELWTSYTVCKSIRCISVRIFGSELKSFEKNECQLLFQNCWVIKFGKICPRWPSHAENCLQGFSPQMWGLCNMMWIYLSCLMLRNPTRLNLLFLD